MKETWRGAARVVSIAQGLDRLLDDMDERLDPPPEPGVEPIEDLLPLSTGLVGLDHVLGGGLRRGEVAWLEADLPSQALAVAHASAGSTPHVCLLDSSGVLSSVTWLVAGAAGVPWSGVRDAWMSEDEWTATSTSLGPLAGRALSLCSVGSVGALRSVVDEVRPDLVVVSEPERLGEPGEIIDELLAMAASTQLTVLVSADEGLPEDAVDGRSRVRRVVMSSCSLGGAAVLLGPDREDLLAFSRVRVEVQQGQVW